MFNFFAMFPGVKRGGRGPLVATRYDRMGHVEMSNRLHNAVLMDYHFNVASILEHYPWGDRLVGEMGELLWRACRNMHGGVIPLLVARGADPSGSYHGTPFVWAALDASSVPALLDLRDAGAPPLSPRPVGLWLLRRALRVEEICACILQSDRTMYGDEMRARILEMQDLLGWAFLPAETCSDLLIVREGPDALLNRVDIFTEAGREELQRLADERRRLIFAADLYPLAGESQALPPEMLLPVMAAAFRLPEARIRRLRRADEEWPHLE